MNRPLLRLLDANANRAREALRVVEDYARFVLDDRSMSFALKELRHELRDATGPLLGAAMLCRDTPGDVGTTTKAAGEFRRDDVADVVTAAGKRVGEALRAIEEYLKVLSPKDASKVESIRYHFYGLEHQISFSLRPAACDFSQVLLYVLITEAACKVPWIEAAEEAILGGADCLQLREKHLDSGELLARARLLVGLCDRYDVPCVINDRPDIALLSGAAGVHVGQGDLPIREVRKVVGREMIVGVSTHCLEQARQAVADGADYIGVGPFFTSSTKPRDFVAGPEYARAVAASIPIPAVAIAGITAENVDEVLATGIPAVAVTASVIGRPDVRAAAKELKARLHPVAQPSLPVVGLTSLPGHRVARASLPLVGQESVPVHPVPQESLHKVAQESVPVNPVAQAFLPVVAQTFVSVHPPRPCAPHERREPELEIRKRNLPHWRLDGATYFVTFRLKAGELSPPERRVILDHMKGGHGGFYHLIAAVVMPDHAHMLLRPHPGFDLSRITKGTKGVTARLINSSRKTAGSLWMDESWDRIIRSQEELTEKIGYIFDNPVKAELVEDAWEYDSLFINQKGE